MIIHGARELQPYGQWAANPGRIKIRVLPPVPTSDYTSENLRQRSEELRQLFVRELGHDVLGTPGWTTLGGEPAETPTAIEA
jgi:1-acyl-sn-glycerol-3-phosphate acyltransferase